MPSNIEIKARARDFPAQAAIAERIATGGPLELAQRDTFFHCPHGRLKLREFGDGTGELIQYERPDEAALRESRYERVTISDPSALHRALARSLGERVVVSKHRTVWFSGRTRIHLDRVDGLGDFLELEVVLAAGDDHGTARAEADALMQQLGIEASDLLTVAYADLIEAREDR